MPDAFVDPLRGKGEQAADFGRGQQRLNGGRRRRRSLQPQPPILLLTDAHERVALRRPAPTPRRSRPPFPASRYSRRKRRSSTSWIMEIPERLVSLRAPSRTYRLTAIT